jgi:hypothetical protein
VGIWNTKRQRGVEINVNTVEIPPRQCLFRVADLEVLAAQRYAAATLHDPLTVNPDRVRRILRRQLLTDCDVIIACEQDAASVTFDAAEAVDIAGGCVLRWPDRKESGEGIEDRSLNIPQCIDEVSPDAIMVGCFTQCHPCVQNALVVLQDKLGYCAKVLPFLRRRSAGQLQGGRSERRQRLDVRTRIGHGEID